MAIPLKWLKLPYQVYLITENRGTMGYGNFPMRNTYWLPYFEVFHGISIDFWCQDQKARDHALNGLKQGRIRVLVATDVAARGLDIKGIGASTSRRDSGNHPHMAVGLTT